MLFRSGSCPEAITYYRNVVALSKAAYGAEAQYEIASCHYALGHYADAEKAAFEVINKSGSYEDWVVKAYLLLGDTYVKQGDLFNAKATYQSIIDNARVEPLRQEAEKKLAALKESESNPKN